MKSFAAAFLSLMLLTGCVSSGSQNGAETSRAGIPDNAAFLAPDLRLDLPDPASMGRSFEVVQMVTAHRGAQTMTFEAHLSITPERVLLVGLDPTGQRLMTVTWRGTQFAVVTAPTLPKEIRPGAMLADLVALYWPEAVVRQSLRAAGADLSVTSNGRIVTQHGQPVLQATYQGGSANPWQGGLHYRNIAWGYDIDVQTLQVSP